MILYDKKIEGYENDLKDLKPIVREKAIELAKQLEKKEGYDRSKAIIEAIKEAEAWFLESDG